MISCTYVYLVSCTPVYLNNYTFVYLISCTHVYLINCTYVYLISCTPVYPISCTRMYLISCTYVFLISCTSVYLINCTYVYLFSCTHMHLFSCTPVVAYTITCTPDTSCYMAPPGLGTWVCLLLCLWLPMSSVTRDRGDKWAGHRLLSRTCHRVSTPLTAGSGLSSGCLGLWEGDRHTSNWPGLQVSHGQV